MGGVTRWATVHSTAPMDNHSKKIIATVDKRQSDHRSAVMEKQAFILTVDQLIKEVKLVEVCTDAHCQISALVGLQYFSGPYLRLFFYGQFCSSDHALYHNDI